MSTPSVELLTTERALSLWPQMVPLIEESIEGNEVSADDLTAQDIFNAVCNDEVAIFACFLDGRLTTILAIQFHGDETTKCATIVAMAGKKLVFFKRHYWQAVLDWLRGNNIKFLDSHVPFDRAMMYTSKFGFDKSCAYIRMTLG